jgi:predicted NBD/HSP70 family sugar kinase
MIDVRPALPPPLERKFAPAALWNRAYRSLVARDPAARPLSVVVSSNGGAVSRHDALSAGHSAAALSLTYVERLVKFLLWQKGGSHLRIAGADEIVAELKRVYSDTGARAFDYRFMGATTYREPFTIEAAPLSTLPEARVASLAIGRNLDGCRIGFDLGGSDRKAAAVIDGKVVFSEEITWDPYFQKDPSYHLEGVHDSLRRAAAHLPRVDAIGGSAAGVYVNNEVRVASLFRGVPPDLFDRHVRRMFFTLQERWGGVPFEVANDGEVTALAGSMSLGDGAVLGIAMGTSLAAGYVTPEGGITPWLNELAFAPVDYHPAAPRDEWSGDIGCGVQYFSQQAVGRLAAVAGFAFPANMPLPEKLIEVQRAMASGDPRARAIYETIGTDFGYAIAHFADHYELRHVLLLGRVSSGAGGEIILDRARAVLRADFPDRAEKIRLHTPDEKDRRHGQAVAAASLPALRR